MRAQPAIEFLNVYGFVFLVIGIVLSVLILIALIPHSVISGQCSFYNGQMCTYSSLYSSSAKGYSLFTLVFSNPQSVPINITSASLIISNRSSVGACTPQILYPGGSAVCIMPSSLLYPVGSAISGFFSINAKICNSGIGSFGSVNCTGNSVSYGGFFSLPVTSRLIVPYTVIVAIGPKNQQLAPVPNTPGIPSNYSIVQNGYFSTNNGSYSFGAPRYVGNTYLGMSVASFPDTISLLGSSNASCSLPYNSTLSVAYTTVYIPNGASLHVAIETANAMEVYYKQQNSTRWQNIFGSGAWSGQGPTQYGPKTVLLGKGVYNIGIEWSDDCGAGLQAISFNGLP